MLASHRLLQQALSRKKKANPRFSMSVLAHGVGVSKPYVSQVLHGKRKPSRRFLDKCFPLLDVGPHERDQIYASLAYERLPNAEARAFFNRQRKSALIAQQSGEQPAPAETFTLAKHSEYQVLSEWQRVAILDLVSCVDFVESSAWVAKRLGITQASSARILEELEKAGLLIRLDGKLRKTDKMLEFVGKVPLPIVRQFHAQMIEKALETLRTQKTDAEYRRRMINGLTVATSADRVEAAKTYLQAALMEFYKILESEKPTEVYQLNFQLFSLTKAEVSS